MHSSSGWAADWRRDRRNTLLGNGSNALGFIELTAVATLQVLMPTAAGRSDPQSGTRLYYDLKWAAGGILSPTDTAHAFILAFLFPLVTGTVTSYFLSGHAPRYANRMAYASEAMPWGMRRLPRVAVSDRRNPAGAGLARRTVTPGCGTGCLPAATPVIGSFSLTCCICAASAKQVIRDIKDYQKLNFSNSSNSHSSQI